MRPFLLLDVDGVLNPFAAAQCPAGFVEYDFFPDVQPVRICTAHGAWLAELRPHFEFVWATAWAEEANRLLAPLLGLDALPCIRVPPPPFAPAVKFRGVREFVGDRAFAWIDDDFAPEAILWARRRPAAALLLFADPEYGLTRRLVDECLRWVGVEPGGNSTAGVLS